MFFYQILYNCKSVHNKHWILSQKKISKLVFMNQMPFLLPSKSAKIWLLLTVTAMVIFHDCSFYSNCCETWIYQDCENQKETIRASYWTHKHFHSKKTLKITNPLSKLESLTNLSQSVKIHLRTNLISLVLMRKKSRMIWKV